MFNIGDIICYKSRIYSLLHKIDNLYGFILDIDENNKCLKVQWFNNPIGKNPINSKLRYDILDADKLFKI